MVEGRAEEVRGLLISSWSQTGEISCQDRSGREFLRKMSHQLIWWLHRTLSITRTYQNKFSVQPWLNAQLSSTGVPRAAQTNSYDGKGKDIHLFANAKETGKVQAPQCNCLPAAIHNFRLTEQPRITLKNVGKTSKKTSREAETPVGWAVARRSRRAERDQWKSSENVFNGNQWSPLGLCEAIGFRWSPMQSIERTMETAINHC
ncbi:hypothetical protein C8R45DRAFT_939513 [Mycena sanguinolenta]|nr:hypothetical protein C8R45DRAFT_939513 [Mycena sanguinolenta]